MILDWRRIGDSYLLFGDDSLVLKAGIYMPRIKGAKWITESYITRHSFQV